MFRVYQPVLRTLRRTLEAAREELSLLETDLGLCAECGSHPPPPLRERAPRPLAHSIEAQAATRQRRVA